MPPLKSSSYKLTEHNYIQCLSYFSGHICYLLTICFRHIDLTGKRPCLMLTIVLNYPVLRPIALQNGHAW